MKKDKLSWVLIIILVVLLLTVGILVAVFFSRSRKGDMAYLHGSDAMSVSEVVMEADTAGVKDTEERSSED